MSRNGSGTYTLPSGNPFVPSTVISSTTMNNTMSDIATALTQSIANDGQTTPVANLPMATFRHTNVGNAAARTDYAAAGQVQDSSLQWLTSVAGTDTITASIAPSPGAYTAGQTFRFVAAGANTTATVTLNINGLGAKSVVNADGGMAIGQIPSGGIVQVVYDGTKFQTVSPAGYHPGFSNMTVYATAGAQTFNIPNGVSRVKVRAWGGGGGGGGAAAGTSGGGGGGGGFGEGIYTVTPGGTISVTVGAGGTAGGVGGTGGTTTVTGMIIAAGGVGGQNSGGGSGGGAGGAVSGGSFQTAGVTGSNGVVLGGTPISGPGGGTFGTPSAPFGVSSGVGANGNFPGGGASGGANNNGGGTGSQGCVIIEY